MRTITIGNQQLNIKDYYCSLDGEYLNREDGKLWLYVNLTDVCNGSCPFCINPCVQGGKDTLDPDAFRKTLMLIKDYIYGVSFTGGEPMLYPATVNEVLGIIQDICGAQVEKDIVTNGTGFGNIISSLDLEKLDSVHVSRHRVADAENNELFGFETTSAYEIGRVISKMNDPAQIVLNCVLMAGGIDSVQGMARYLEFASELGVRNVSFIGLSRHNSFCVENYIDPRQFDLSNDERFHIWNEYCDHDFCSCSSGSYDAGNGSIRFYFRRVGDLKAPYVRQLVYTADNRLLTGFSGKEIRFD